MSAEKKWHAEAWKFPEDIRKWNIAGGGFVFLEDVLSEEAQKLEYGPLFVYMFRRFGPTEWGGDNHKSIADWFLTTPNPNVVLWVKPSVHGGDYSFGYGVHADRFDNRRDEKQKQEVTEALHAAVEDLKTPVAVRDAYINAWGDVPDEDLPMIGEGDDAEVDAVPFFKYAGYGVDHKWFEKMDQEDSEDNDIEEGD